MDDWSVIFDKCLCWREREFCMAVGTYKLRKLTNTAGLFHKPVNINEHQGTQGLAEGRGREGWGRVWDWTGTGPHALYRQTSLYHEG